MFFKKTKQIDKNTYAKITKLTDQGNAEFEINNYVKARQYFKDALNLVPKPIEDWEATMWILASIGDTHFSEQDYENGLRAFSDAVRCPGGLGNPFIHLRLGEIQYELGNIPRAKDELVRAFMGAGLEIFDEEDPKYLILLRETINIP